MKENAEKFRALDPAELDKQLREGAEQMFRLRFQLSMGQMDGVKKLRSLRKERARILTVLQQKGVAPSAAAAPVPLVTKTRPKTAAKKAAPKPAAPKKAAPKAAAKSAAKSKKGA
ncbi:MAG TPA: 50S ribosomal protein L29 [Bryobacteraceae bacterium]|jgi:large subunit ribosomal protein L29|nr:50S ribosomal protein L29 [Bryobacteraceae bacterium]